MSENAPRAGGAETAVLTVTIGLLVGGNFAIGKFVVLQEVAALSVFYWQLAGAALLLVAATLARRGQPIARRLPLAAAHLRYYLIGGIIGITGPHLLSYIALARVPAGLFAMLVTLSPLLTFLLSSLVARRLLPLHRLAGILIGLAGVSIATAQKVSAEDLSQEGLLAALAVPALLALTNVYRERAYPAGGQPLALAAGTLASQAIIVAPVMALVDAGRMPVPPVDLTDIAMLGLAAVTALSYILTFALYRRTDGVGFAQVGYFVTLTGIAAGAIFFDEPIGPWFVLAVVLLFVGMAVANGQPGWFGRRIGATAR